MIPLAPEKALPVWRLYEDVSTLQETAGCCSHKTGDRVTEPSGAAGQRDIRTLRGARAPCERTRLLVHWHSAGGSLRLRRWAGPGTGGGGRKGGVIERWEGAYPPLALTYFLPAALVHAYLLGGRVIARPAKGFLSPSLWKRESADETAPLSPVEMGRWLRREAGQGSHCLQTKRSRFFLSSSKFPLALCPVQGRVPSRDPVVQMGRKNRHQRKGNPTSRQGEMSWKVPEKSDRSSNSLLLHTPRTKLVTMGDRAFCSTDPRLWNALPEHLKAPQSLD
ncbi:hypothetical protein SKAU_G00296930 [Synaphobranchus kaupii]|uniref:Uncharacterized protein n=1 Tax=Synaphobranchus kaupii TaxID=118154 RepID=A0A9Q1EUZ9_SYNKA|nr:hypothetical protein SKAU_G00296930 [Synaphobranchus kaupii]